MRLAALALGLSLAGCASALSVRDGVLDEGKLQGLECVSVLPFENLTPHGPAGRLVAQEFATALLTSERFNVLAPSEAEQILRLVDAPLTALSSDAAARKYGEVLGVQAVLIGSVTEYGREDLTSRTPVAEPVVGFTARVVDTASGRVLWTATASNYDNPAGLAIPQAQATILKQTVRAAIGELVDARDSRVSNRGLCAAAYVSLQKGERPAIASIAELRRIHEQTQASSGPATMAPASGSPSPAVAATAPARAMDPPADGARALDLPPLAGDSGLPALPDVPADGGAVPALPPLGGDSGMLPLPPMTDDGTVPALPPLDDASGGLPPLPGSADGLFQDSGEPPARALRTAPPKALLAKLGARQKALMKQLYRRNYAVLPTDFPRKLAQKPALYPRSKKSLSDLAQLLRNTPGMRVRLELNVNATGPGMNDAAARQRGQKQAQLVSDFLTSQRAPMDRISIRVTGRGTSKGKKGGTAKSRLDVTVLAYPR